VSDTLLAYITDSPLTVGRYGVDIDAVAGWLGSYGGEDSTSDISRGSEENSSP
jgi:hypothetical protein